MESADAGSPNRGRIRLWHSLDAKKRAIVTRLCKYVVLLCGVGLTMMVVYDAYSFYIARRDIDAELRAKKLSSLEQHNLAAERQRALAITTLEARCLERTQLTMFRILDAEHDRIRVAYNAMVDEKNQMIEVVKKWGPGLVDVDEAVKFLDRPQFQLEELSDHLKPRNSDVEKGPNYTKLMDEIAAAKARYVVVAERNAPLRRELEDLIVKNGKFDLSKYWSMDAIKIVVDRIDQLRNELRANRDKFGDLEDVMSRYAVWTGALTGAATQNPLQDDIAYVIEKANTKLLREQNCDRFKDYYAAVNQRILQTDPVEGKSWRELTWAEMLPGIRSSYRQYLQRYFNQPPAAQTMFVTMFLGALGAWTLNMLRMSKVGWWAKQDDPLWGDIIVGPLLGSLAAFAVFLVGSSGLLLTTETNGAQPLSAYFIGLLGFLSGLVYDEAFGRVRRIGTQMFAAGTTEEVANARSEDRSLAEILRANSASLAAGLALKYGIGTRLSLESDFTLLIPSDEAMGRLSLADWTLLNDPQREEFERWYHHHHSAKRVTRKDMVGDGKTSAVQEIVLDDGTSCAATAEGNEVKIGDIRILIADLTWNKGVIHILSAELR